MAWSSDLTTEVHRAPWHETMKMWGFLFNGIFHYKASSYWGNLIYGNLHLMYCGGCNSTRHTEILYWGHFLYMGAAAKDERLKTTTPLSQARSRHETPPRDCDDMWCAKARLTCLLQRCNLSAQGPFDEICSLETKNEELKRVTDQLVFC